MSPEQVPPPGSGRAVSSTGLRVGLALSGLTVTELWVRYVGLSGSLSVQQLLSAVSGGSLPPHDHDVVAHALNEHFTEEGGDHPVAYTDEIDGHAGEPRT